MKILIAPDSFKDSLPATEVARAIKKGILQVVSDAKVSIAPLADGGEGTVEAIVTATGGEIEPLEVYDPLMRRTGSFFGLLPGHNKAIVEMAAASGLEKLRVHERNPMVTTTYGTGQLIKAALDRGCSSIIIGLGGSATNDGGTGMARALGIRFLDKENNEIPHGGGYLNRLVHIDIGNADPRIIDTIFTIASDVTNPLTGKNGASQIYGPQKGATPEMVKQLDDNLKHYAQIVREQLGVEIEKVPGAGAAGGLAAGLIAFTNAEMESGFNIVSKMTGLEQRIYEADLVITGEGKIDRQTTMGKTIGGVVALCRKHGKKIWAVGGTIDPGVNKEKLNIDALFPISEKKIPLEESIRNAAKLLEETGIRIGKVIGTSTQGP